MQERAIQIRSVNRQKIGRNRPEDFIIKFELTLPLDNDMYHELAMDRVSMTYSWHNINDEYGNNQIKYSPDNGSNWKTINFVDGMYSYDDLNDYIHESIEKGSDKSGENFSISLTFVLSSYRVVIEISNNFQLDLRNSNFGDLIGFDKKIITQTDYSSKLPNITNITDVISVNCDIITDSIVDGRFGNTLGMIPTDNLTRLYPFTFEPRRALFSPVSRTTISEMRITVTDSIGRLINLNDVDWHISLILRSRLT